MAGIVNTGVDGISIDATLVISSLEASFINTSISILTAQTVKNAAAAVFLARKDQIGRQRGRRSANSRLKKEERKENRERKKKIIIS